MPETVYDDEHIRVERLTERRVMVVTRKATPAETPQQLADIFAKVTRIRSDQDRGWGLVLDVRQAPGRSDDGFESAVAPARISASKFFARMVLLVKSAAGELQVRRLAREDGREALVTRDYDEALRLAAGAPAPSRALAGR